MNSKKKMVVAISALAMVILAAVIAVVAVLAAQQVSVKSSVNITYTAGAEVIGSVSAEYKMQDGTTKSLNSVSFDGEEEDGAGKELAGVGNLTFSENNKYVEFTFTFKNDSTITSYTATLAFTNEDGTVAGTIENMKLYSKIGDNNYTQILIGEDDELSELTSVEVPKESTVVCVLKVELGLSAKNAKFTGTMLWTLAVPVV